MSPARYMREKARALPVGDCFVAPSDWQESGLATVIVTRRRPDGNLAAGLFEVDTFCLGVIDAMYFASMTDEKLEKILGKRGFEKISYEEAHNIIYGAIAFAEEGGIKPCKDFMPAGYILEEDTDDVPLIEYEFGKEGKHLLMISPDLREKPYIGTLRKNLGKDFDYVLPVTASDAEKRVSSLFLNNITKGFEEMHAEMSRNPSHKHSYRYPDYPKQLTVKNQFIADELMSEKNNTGLPDEVISRILALPNDEAADDIGNVVMYVIGRTYRGINDDTIGTPTDNAILYSLLVLTALGSEKGFEAVREVIRQKEEFADYHLGDWAPEYLHQALYATGRNRVADIEELLNEPGVSSYLRGQVSEALVMIALNEPERRSEIIDLFRRYLAALPERLPRLDGCDAYFAGTLMSDMIDLSATELIPEIKAVYATDCVEKAICGDCDKVVREIEKRRGPIDVDRQYGMPDVYKCAAEIRNVFNRT